MLELVVNFVEHLVQWQVLVLDMEKSVTEMEHYVLTKSAEDKLLHDSQRAVQLFRAHFPGNVPTVKLDDAAQKDGRDHGVVEQ